MSEQIYRRVARLAGRQHFVFSIGQAAGLHATRGLVQSAVRTGRWERVHRGVYRIGDTPRTLEQAAMAACLAGGDQAVASHATAVWLWRLQELVRLVLPSEPIELTVPRGGRRVVRGVSVRESRDLGGAMCTKVAGVPVTTAVRTLIDIAPRLEPDTLERLLDEMLRRRMLTVRRLAWHLSTTPRRGLLELRTMVEKRSPARPVLESDLEDLFARVIAMAGMPEPVAQHVVRYRGKALGRLDFAYPEVRVGVELDGGQHFGVRQKREDTARQNRVQSRDWNLLRFYRSDLQRRPQEVCAEVARTLASRALVLRRPVPRTR